MTEIGDILDEHKISNPHEVSDEELLKIRGIGPATLEAIRDVKAVSVRFIDLGGGYNVAPGNVIPQEYGPAEYVKKGWAEWR